MSPFDPDTPYREFGLFAGLVTDDVDPLKQGRVKVRVPGYLDPATWAQVLLLGSPFGRGVFCVPLTGQQVLVGFLQGDYAQPIVLGTFASPSTEAGYRADKDAALTKGMVTVENENFILALGQPGTNTPYAAICTRDEPTMMITLDIDQRAIEIQGPTSVCIKSQGHVKIDSPLITLGNRRVQRNGKPI